jgi:hypothetical protein
VRVGLNARIAILDAAFERAKNVDPLSRLVGDLVGYLCVRVAGLLETSIQDLMVEYCANRAAPDVASFVEGILRAGTCDRERILQLLGYFDPSWPDLLNELLDDEHWAAVNSVYGQRHSVAHGRDITLSLGQIDRYYALVKDVLAAVEQLLIPKEA